MPEGTASGCTPEASSGSTSAPQTKPDSVDRNGPPHGSLRRVLLVDDNDRYAAALTAELEKRGVREIVRVLTARDGVAALREQPDAFDGVVSDISMENQVSGLNVLIAARRLDKYRRSRARTGFDNAVNHDSSLTRAHADSDSAVDTGSNRPLLLACATTGLDSAAGYWINRFLLGTLFRCDYLIPKRPIKRDGCVIWIRGAKVW